MVFSQIPLWFNGVEFDASIWDYPDGTADVELVGFTESQYLYYPGSSLVRVFVGKTVRSSHLVEDIREDVLDALAKA